MLKKKGVFKVLLALFFCFSLIGGNLIFDTKKSQDAVAADVPDLTQTASGSGWSFVKGGSSDTLYLSGNKVDWTGSILLENSLNIVLQNNSSTKIYCDSGSAFYCEDFSGLNLNISGKGTLEIEISEDVFDMGFSAFFGINQISFEGLTCVCNVSGEETEVAETTLTGESLNGSYYKFYSKAVASTSTVRDFGGSEDETESSGHTHSFEYTSSGAVLTASCSSEDCSESASVTLSVDDLNYGGSPVVTLGGLDNFNSKTSAGLALSDFTQTFYKTETAGSTTDGTLVASTEANLDAGFYYVTLTSNSEKFTQEQTLVCAFKINKVSPGEITGEDKTTTLVSENYDVSQMFTLPNGTSASYEIVNEGTTGTGTIEGSTLSFTAAGEFKIKCIISETENYTEITLTKTLSVTTTLEFTVSLSDWNEGQDANSPSISLSGKTATYVYYTDMNLTIETSSVNGASGNGAIPTKAGVYYVKATIAASGIYQESSASASFTIWGTPSISVSGSSETINMKYNEISEDGVDLSGLFTITGGHGDVSYYLVSSENDELLSSSNFEITAIGTYVIKIKTAATNCYYESACTCTLQITKASFNLETDLNFVSVYPYGTPRLSATINGGGYGAEISFEYYSDADCTEENKLDVAPTAVGGPYYVLIKVAETEVSNAAEIKKSYTITKRKITSILWDEDKFVYNGAVQEIKAYYVNSNGDTIQLKLTIAAGKVFKDAGDYQASVEIASEIEEAAYEFDNSVVLTKNYTMAKRILVVDISGNNKRFYKETSTLEELDIRSSICEGSLPTSDTPLPYTLALEGVSDYANLDMDKYKIVLTVTDNNYEISYNESYYLIFNQITKFDFTGADETESFNGWTYGNTPAELDFDAYYGKDKAVVTYAVADSNENFTSEKPTLPGSYVIKVVIDDEYEWLRAEKIDTFTIRKISIERPSADKTEFIYNGKEQTYEIPDSVYYTVTGAKQINAGSHTVTVRLKESYYKWADDTTELIRSYDYDFVISKMKIEKPEKNTTIFKYNGKEQKYFNFTNEDLNKYKIINEWVNTQTEVGKYTIYVAPANNNLMWSDGTDQEVAFEFVINQNNISKPIAKNSEGEIIEKSPVTIIETGESGIDPDVKLNVLSVSDENEIASYKSLIKNKISTFSSHDKIFAVYGLSLTSGNESVKLSETFTLKLAIPEEIKNGVFDLYKISKDENGEEKVELVEYITYNDFVYLNAYDVADYVFVYEQESLVSLIIIFSVASGLLLIALAVQLYFLLRKKKSTAKQAQKVALSALVAPIFYVKSEVVTSIILGVLMGVLVIANIVLLVLLILKNNKQKKINSQAVVAEEPNHKNKKAKKIIQNGNLVLTETTEENTIDNSSLENKNTNEK